METVNPNTGRHEDPVKHYQRLYAEATDRVVHYESLSAQALREVTQRPGARHVWDTERGWHD